jgi:hypothetical protein
MKLTTKLIQSLVDFEYGKAKGLGYVQILLSFGTFFEVIKLKYDISRWWYVIIIPVALVMTWLWGRFLRKIKFREREASFITEQNKYLMKIHNRIK